MGVHNKFGSLPVRIRRVVYYSLSPFEQDAWAQSVSRGLPNLMRRFLAALPTTVPGFLVSIGTYQWANWVHEGLLRKNPEDFENDE